MKVKLKDSQLRKVINEMRFDGKKPIEFSDETVKLEQDNLGDDNKVNEFFGKKVKNYVNSKKENLTLSLNKIIESAKREGVETAKAAEIFKRVLTKQSVSDAEISFLKEQSIDLIKIIGVAGLGVISIPLTIFLEKLLKKKFNISILPSENQIEGSDDEINEGRKRKRRKSTRSKSKKKKNTLCARGKRAAKAKYEVYPSAYANGYAVQVCKGTIAGLDGNKKCSGSYCRKKKNESYEIGNVEVVERLDEDLATWFGTKKKKKGSKQPQGPWVNICRKKKGGGHPACGRSDSDKGGYPVCRAKSVASNMSQDAKDSACRRKRRKERNDGKSGKGQSPSPIKVKNYKPRKRKSSKRKSKKNESVNINRMMITENRTIVSEGLRYHLDNQIPLSENIYRYGSDNYFNLITEVKILNSKNKIDLSPKDEELVNEFNVEKGIYGGKEVWLNTPFEVVELNEAEYKGRKVSLNSPKKSGSKNYVFVTGCLKDKNKVKRFDYGSAMRDKLKNPDRRKAYSARHGCEGLSLKDKCTKKYWACRKPKDFAGVNAWW